MQMLFKFSMNKTLYKPTAQVTIFWSLSKTDTLRESVAHIYRDLTY